MGSRRVPVCLGAEEKFRLSSELEGSLCMDLACCQHIDMLEGRTTDRAGALGAFLRGLGRAAAVTGFTDVAAVAVTDGLFARFDLVTAEVAAAVAVKVAACVCVPGTVVAMVVDTPLRGTGVVMTFLTGGDVTLLEAADPAVEVGFAFDTTAGFCNVDA